MRARIACIGLAAILFADPALAQPADAREGEAHILSAFTSHADPGVLADSVRLGPALRAEFGGDTDSRRIYAALVDRTAGKPLRVRPLTPEEAARHASLVGGLPEPLLVLEAGEVALLMQYAPKEKDVVFVEQLRGAQVELPREAPKPAAVVEVPVAPVAKPAVVEMPKPVVVEKPKPVPAAVVVEKPKPAPPARPRGECVIKPVMTDDDLYNCGARP
jgi:hypothetical protein